MQLPALRDLIRGRSIASRKIELESQVYTIALDAATMPAEPPPEKPADRYARLLRGVTMTGYDVNP